jgi:hypothetical protein
VGVWQRRWVVAACAVLVASMVPFVLYLWYFGEAEHVRIASPDGRWVVVVTKRMERFPEPVEVRLKVVQNWESPRIWLDIEFDEPDIWPDVKPDSYRVAWHRQPSSEPGGGSPTARCCSAVDSPARSGWWSRSASPSDSQVRPKQMLHLIAAACMPSLVHSSPGRRGR